MGGMIGGFPAHLGISDLSAVSRYFRTPFFGSISGAVRQFSAAGRVILGPGFGFNYFLEGAGA